MSKENDTRKVKAYSLEKQEDMTSIKANNLALKGELISKHAFQCSEQCSVPYTCANFNTTSDQRKVPPYFTTRSKIEDHIDGCEVKEKLIKKANNEAKYKRKTSEIIKVNATSKGFNAPTHTQSKTVSKSSVAQFSTNNDKHSSGSNKLPTKNFKMNIDSMSQLVDIYKSSEYDNENAPIEIFNRQTTLNQLFISLNHSSEFTDDSFVYHGKFFINDIGDSYHLNSSTKIRYENDDKRVSIFLSKNMIIDHDVLKMLESNIGKVVYTYCLSEVVSKMSKNKSIYLHLDFQKNVNNLLFDFNR